MTTDSNDVEPARDRDDVDELVIELLDGIARWVRWLVYVGAGIFVAQLAATIALLVLVD